MINISRKHDVIVDKTWKRLQLILLSKTYITTLGPINTCLKGRIANWGKAVYSGTNSGPVFLYKTE